MLFTHFHDTVSFPGVITISVDEFRISELYDALDHIDLCFVVIGSLNCYFTCDTQELSPTFHYWFTIGAYSVYIGL